VISPVIGLYCHRRQWNYFRQLDASVEASEPHDFAVRLRAVRPQHVSVHRIPSRVRDDREPPLLVGRDGGAYEAIWVNRERKYFPKQGWTGPKSTQPAPNPMRQKAAHLPHVTGLLVSFRLVRDVRFTGKVRC
jgi:hypothetical protein